MQAHKPQLPTQGPRCFRWPCAAWKTDRRKAHGEMQSRVGERGALDLPPVFREPARTPPPPPSAPPRTGFPASSPREGSLPVLSRPKQKQHRARTLLLGHALHWDSRLYTRSTAAPALCQRGPLTCPEPPPPTSRPQGPKLMTALTSSLFACRGLLQTRPNCSL